MTDLRGLESDSGRSCGRNPVMAERMVAGRSVNPRRCRRHGLALAWRDAIAGILSDMAMAPAGAGLLLGATTVRSACDRSSPDDYFAATDDRGSTGGDRGEGRGAEALARRARALLRARVVVDAADASPGVSINRAHLLIAQDQTLTDAIAAIERSRAIRKSGAFRKTNHLLVDYMRGATDDE